MLEYYILNTAHVLGRFRRGAKAPLLPSVLLAVEANRASLTSILLQKALYLPG